MNEDLERRFRQVTERLDKLRTLALLGSKSVYDIDEASLITGMSRGYLYKLTSQRLIPHYKKGRKLYFKKAELEQWLLEAPVKTQGQIEREAATYIVAKGRNRN